MRYHPRIGYTYMPSMKQRVQGTSGGYLVRTNAAGFRSEREFERELSPTKFRALVYGDSQTAGDGASNPSRFSDLLEKAVPGLEIYNYGISGTGTDQHFLTFGEFGSVDHDLVVLVYYVENICRLKPRLIKTRDLNGEWVYRAKPYYELGPQGLELCNVPVPKQAWSDETLPKELLPYVYTFGNEYSVFREPAGGYASLLRRMVPDGPLRDGLKQLATRLRKTRPFPQYDSRKTPEWLLLREILATWIRTARKPVLLVLLPHVGMHLHADPTRYQARFAELAKTTGCMLHDLSPELIARSRDGFALSQWDHLSLEGHEAVAGLLTPVLSKLVAQKLS